MLLSIQQDSPTLTFTLTPHLTAFFMSLHLYAGRVHGSETGKHVHGQKYRLVFESIKTHLDVL